MSLAALDPLAFRALIGREIGTSGWHQIDQAAIDAFAGAIMSVNYGIEHLRFLAPVRAGSRVRGRFALKDLRERRPGEWLSVLDARVEIESSDKPALIAEWLGLHVIA